MFRDLNLDQVFAAVAAGRDEYDLMPFFRAPLRDVRAVEYRHQVQRDLEDEALSIAVAEFALRMREMREQPGPVRQAPHQVPERALVPGRGRIYCQAVAPWLTRSSRSSLAHAALPRSGQYLADYTQSAAFTGLAADIGRVTSALADSEVLRQHQGQPGQGHQVRR